MAAKAEEKGYVAVFPDGLGQIQGWNAGFIDLTGLKPDDAAFVNDTIDDVERRVGIDPDRVYVCGHSNGAFLANYVGAKLGGRLAAIGSVAGTVGLQTPSGPKTIPDPGAPVSAILIHGRRDTTVPYDNTVQGLLKTVTAPDSAKWWEQRDGCNPIPQITKSPNGNVETELFTGGKNGTEVELVSIGNGTHNWPGGLTMDGPETATGVDAADLLFAFFDAHLRRH